MTTKLKSVQEGIEMGLSVEQCSFISEELKKSGVTNGVYHDSTQGANYGFIAFPFPKIGYYSVIADNQMKALKGIAKKSDTQVYLWLNANEIRFYAQ